MLHNAKLSSPHSTAKLDFIFYGFGILYNCYFFVSSYVYFKKKATQVIIIITIKSKLCDEKKKNSTFKAEAYFTVLTETLSFE